jgi:hypothetical protein
MLPSQNLGRGADEKRKNNKSKNEHTYSLDLYHCKHKYVGINKLSTHV